jgi:hypothetical protein
MMVAIMRKMTTRMKAVAIVQILIDRAEIGQWMG